MEEIKQIYDNGLVAVAVPIEGRRKVGYYIGIDVGSKNETREKKGGSHLLEHMMFRSNEFRNSDEIDEVGEFNGITRNAQTSLIDTKLFFSLPPDKIELAVDLSYEAFTCKEYDEREFDVEKLGPVTTELNMYDRDPTNRFARRVLFPRIYQDTPLQDAVIGTFKSVNALEIDDMLKLKDQFYVPNNTVLVAAGAVDKDRFFERVYHSFGKLDRKDVNQPDLDWSFNSGVEYVEFDEFKHPENNQQDQAFVYTAFEANSSQTKDYPGLSLINSIIGTGFTSLLFRDLRKQRGIAYGLESYHYCQRGNAVMLLGIPGLHPNRLEEAVDGMHENVEKIKSGGLSVEYIDGKKTQLKSLLLDVLEKNSGQAGRVIEREFDHPYCDPDKLIDIIEGMSKDDIAEVAIRNFDKNDPLYIIASAPGYINRFTP